MLQSDKDALHYEVVAQTAHKVEKVATELARLHKDSILDNERIELRKKHLLKYLDELSNLLAYWESKYEAKLSSLLEANVWWLENFSVPL